jgi:hypothetical protein
MPLGPGRTRYVFMYASVKCSMFVATQAGGHLNEIWRESGFYTHMRERACVCACMSINQVYHFSIFCLAFTHLLTCSNQTFGLPSRQQLHTHLQVRGALPLFAHGTIGQPPFQSAACPLRCGRGDSRRAQTFCVALQPASLQADTTGINPRPTLYSL